MDSTKSLQFLSFSRQFQILRKTKLNLQLLHIHGRMCGLLLASPRNPKLERRSCWTVQSSGTPDRQRATIESGVQRRIATSSTCRNRVRHQLAGISEALRYFARSLSSVSLMIDENFDGPQITVPSTYGQRVLKPGVCEFSYPYKRYKGSSSSTNPASELNSQITIGDPVRWTFSIDQSLTKRVRDVE